MPYIKINTNEPYKISDDLVKKVLDNHIEIVKNTQRSDCLHDNCPSCHGTGVRADGLGACVHMISCPCRKCTPYC